MTAATPTPAPAHDEVVEFITQLETILGLPAVEVVPYAIDLVALADLAYKRGRDSALALSGAAS